MNQQCTVAFAILALGMIVRNGEAQVSKPIPKFSDYPVADSEYYKGPRHKMIVPKDLKSFPYFSDASNGKPTFAGHFYLTGAGIGTGEIADFIVDARSGKIFYDPPFSICCVEKLGKGYGFVDMLEYRLSSKLLIVRGERNEDGKPGTYYYKFENDKLTLVRAIPLSQHRRAHQ